MSLIIVYILVFVVMVLIAVLALKGAGKTKENYTNDPIKTKEYEKYYDEKEIEEEIQRQKEKGETNKKTKGVLLVISAFYLFAVVTMIIISFETIYFLILISVIFIPLGIYAINSSRKSYAYKKVVVKKMLDDKYPGSKYQMEYGVDHHDYRQFEYNEGYDDFYSEDKITLMHNEKPITLSEVRTTSTETDSEGHTHTTTEFQGIFGFVETNFKSHNRIFLGNGGHLFEKGIKLDNDLFNKKFKVYSDNEVNVYKLLTPVNMERLLSTKDYIPTLQLFYNGSKLFFKFSHSNILEYKKTKEASALELASLDELLSYITKLIDEIEKELKKKLS